MGKILDFLLGRNFKTSKFKTLARLAISRTGILKNQKQVQYNHAKSDVIQLLKLGRQESALLRVERVIKDHNMMDVFVMIEDYCHLLTESVILLKKNKECPDALKEGISSLIFASSRCGEFPELQGIRGIFVKRFGKEFADRAIELRNNCGVNPKIIQKLSAQRPSLESRLEVLKQIASENNIKLHLEEAAPADVEEKSDVSQKQRQQEFIKSTKLDYAEPQDETHVFPEELNLDQPLSETFKARKKYRDVIDAAQDAYESAAYAAAAARAAVDLSRSESRNNYQYDHRVSRCHRQAFDSDASLRPELLTGGYEICPIDNIGTESEGEDAAEDNGRKHLKELKESQKKPWIDRSRTPSTSSSDSDRSYLSERKLSYSQSLNERVGNRMDFCGIDKDAEREQHNVSSPKYHDLDSYRTPRFPTKEHQHIRQYNADQEEGGSDDNGNKLPYQSPKLIPWKSDADTMVNPVTGKSKLRSTYSADFGHLQHLGVDRKHLSMRTRRAGGD